MFSWLVQTIYKKFKEPLDVYSTIFPLYYVCTKVGLAPFRLSSTENQRKYFHNCPRKLTRTFLSTVLILITSIYSLIDFKPAIENNSDRLKYFQDVFSNTIFTCSIFFGCLFARRVAEAFRIVDEVDVELKTPAVWTPYKQTQIKILVNLLIFGAIIIATFTLICVAPIIDNVDYDLHVFCKVLILIITDLLPYYINILMELQYYHYLDIIRQRFRLLNEYLEALSKDQLNSGLDGGIVTIASNIDKNNTNKPIICGNLTKTIKIVSEPVFIVDQIIALHIKLTNAAHLINYTFCIQQLLRIAVAFVSIVTALFWLSVEFSKSSPTTATSGGYDLIFTCWASSNILEILLIVWITSETCDEANTCPRILHKIRNNTLNIKLQESIEIYSLQLYHNRLSFTVCGLFPLDYTLLYTIVAGVTTYLVILIQFNNTDFIVDGINNTTNTTL